MDDSRNLASLDPAGRGVRVAFRREGDRWVHSLESTDGTGAWIPVWKTSHLAWSEPWPASPPLQSLERSKLPDGRTAFLLVGMSGTSHWSASIEQGQAPGELVFDIACRMSKLPAAGVAQLGSDYERIDLAAPDGIEFATLEDVTDTEIQVEANRARIRPLAIPQRLPGTARWRYRVSCPSTIKP